MRNAALRKRFPDEPWRWNRRWANGVIVSDERPTAIALWICTIVWEALTLSTLFLVHRDRPNDSGPSLIVLAFASAGIFIVAGAIFWTVRAVKFGKSQLTLEPFPVRPGEPFVAHITSHSRLQDVTEYTAKLHCVRREVCSNGNGGRTTFDHILWEEIRPAQAERAADETLIRATFELPPDAKQTGERNSYNPIVWRLIMQGNRAGMDYRSTFEMPVINRAPRRSCVATSIKVSNATGGNN